MYNILWHKEIKSSFRACICYRHNIYITQSLLRNYVHTILARCLYSWNEWQKHELSSSWVDLRLSLRTCAQFLKLMKPFRVNKRYQKIYKTNHASLDLHLMMNLLELEMSIRFPWAFSNGQLPDRFPGLRSSAEQWRSEHLTPTWSSSFEVNDSFHRERENHRILFAHLSCDTVKLPRGSVASEQSWVFCTERNDFQRDDCKPSRKILWEPDGSLTGCRERHTDDGSRMIFTFIDWSQFDRDKTSSTTQQCLRPPLMVICEAPKVQH